MIVRIFAFLVLLFLVVTLPTWLLAVCALIYAFRFTAYELIVVGACIDTYYGGGTLLYIPYYTFFSIAIVFIAEFIKPRISVYNEDT
jgi:hypothetical protein